MTAEHTKTQNSDTHLHSEIYQHCMSCRNYRNKGLNYMAVWIAALAHTVTGSMRRLCGLHQVTLYHMATCYITTVPMYFRVTKNSRCGIPPHVTTHIHAFEFRRVEIRRIFRGTSCLRLPCGGEKGFSETSVNFCPQLGNTWRFIPFQLLRSTHEIKGNKLRF